MVTAPSYDGIDTRPLQAPPVDALLLVSFGGPEAPEHVLPFMENVTRGRGIPAARLEEVSRHYLDVFHGVSPINAQARALKAALEAGVLLRVQASDLELAPRLVRPQALDRVVHGAGEALTVDLAAWAAAERDPMGYDPVIARTREHYARLVGVPASRVAAGSQTSVLTSVVAPPMTPASPIGPESSAMTRSTGSSGRTTSSRVVTFSPLSAGRTTIGPASRSPS